MRNRARWSVEAMTGLAADHPRRTLAIALAITLAGALAATRLRLDPSVVSFLPAHHRAVVDFRKTLEGLGATDQHIVLIELPRGADPSSYEALVDDLAGRYERLPFVGSVDSRLPDPDELVQHLLPYSVLMLRPEEVDSLAALLADDAIRRSMARNRMLLSTPQSFFAKEMVKLDPLGLRELFLKRLPSGAAKLKLDLASGYLLSTDHTAFLMIVHPRFAAHDVGSSRTLMKAVRGIDAAALASFHRLQPESPLPRISEAGAYAIDDEDARLIGDDLVANVVVSVVGILLLFLFAFRRWAAIVYALGPMLAAIVVTFGFAAVTVRTLSAASAGFAALLAGLGIDFITVLYQRFTEECNRGTSVGEAIRTTMRTTMKGVAAAAITTAATFYAFLSTDFRGMAQMGLITGTGILVFLAAVATILPALIVLIESDHKRPPKIRLHALGTARLMRVCISHPRATVAVWCVVTAIAAVRATGIEFNDDAGRLRPAGTAAIRAQERAARIFGQNANVALLVADGGTADQALERAKGALPLVERLSHAGRLGGFDTLAGVLPTMLHQRQALARMHELPADAFDSDRVARSIANAAAENGFKVSAFDEFTGALRRALAVRQAVDAGSVEDPVLARVTSRFIQRHNGVWYSVTYVYPPAGGWAGKVPPELLAISASSPHLTFTGVNIVSAALREVARYDAARSTLIGLIAVFVLFGVAFRSVAYAFLSFVPFVTGATGMLAIMAGIGLELNLINIFAGLMIVGVATDYAVYILQRYRENPAIFPQAAIDTGQAVAMAALTTIAGYGSFAVSHYPGLRSIGYITTFGIGVSALAALTLLPALMVIKLRMPPRARR
ncbi:MAG TPA: MMPL family transporter [Thermoanaerobaculia bacterium]|nr:MMPL family transporter [Thermoanaerobaculia bacterium]